MSFYCIFYHSRQSQSMYKISFLTGKLPVRKPKIKSLILLPTIYMSTAQKRSPWKKQRHLPDSANIIFPGFSRNTIRCPSRNILHPCVLQRLRNCWKTPLFPYWRLLCGQVFNLSSFNRAFKEVNHCTPSQFRKMADFSLDF